MNTVEIRNLNESDRLLSKKIVEAELYDAKGRMVSSGASRIPSYQSFHKTPGKTPNKSLKYGSSFENSPE